MLEAYAHLVYMVSRARSYSEAMPAPVDYVVGVANNRTLTMTTPLASSTINYVFTTVKIKDVQNDPDRLMYVGMVLLVMEQEGANSLRLVLSHADWLRPGDTVEVGGGPLGDMGFMLTTPNLTFPDMSKEYLAYVFTDSGKFDLQRSGYSSLNEAGAKRATQGYNKEYNYTVVIETASRSTVKSTPAEIRDKIVGIQAATEQLLSMFILAGTEPGSQHKLYSQADIRYLTRTSQDEGKRRVDAAIVKFSIQHPR